jgi:hypothetical protein
MVGQMVGRLVMMMERKSVDSLVHWMDSMTVLTMVVRMVTQKALRKAAWRVVKMARWMVVKWVGTKVSRLAASTARKSAAM